MDVPKHIFFDMDGTLTRSRSQIDEQTARLLYALKSCSDVVIVSGAHEKQMQKQLPGIRAFFLAQNGNVAIDMTIDYTLHTGESIAEYDTRVASDRGSQGELWRKSLNWMQKHSIFNAISAMMSHSPVRFKDIEDLVQERGAQISYSILGHNAPLEQKEAADPEKKIRQQLIESQVIDIPHVLPAGLLKACHAMGVQWAIGGTTCIDFYLDSKGKNIAQFLKYKNWKPEDCVYIGDALFPGGNDFSVQSVIPCVAIADQEECRNFMAKLLS